MDANHIGGSRHAILLVQPDSWQAIMDKTVVAVFLEYSPNPTWLADSDGRCVYTNQALAEITALTPAQLEKLSWLELIADEDRNVSSILWQQARINRQPYRARLCLRGGGSARGSAMEIVGAGHIAPDGAEMWLFTAVASAFSTKELQPIEIHLQATLNVLPIQAWYAHASGVLAFVNDATAQYLGLPSDHPLRFGADLEAPWDSHLVFLHPEDRAYSRKQWREHIPAGTARENQFRVLGANGDYRWFLSRAEPLRDSDGRIQHWVGVNIDINEGKRANEALDAARERIGRAMQSAAIAEISASLSHRIVQPLAAIVANARAALNWLSSGNLDIAQANAALEGVLRDGMSVGNVVHEMRQLFDRRRPNPQAIDLNSLAEQVITLQAPDLRDKGVSVALELSPDLPVAVADRAQIPRVIFNLIVDACDAMSHSPNSKQLTVRSSFDEERVCLEVENNGSSIANLQHVFDAFLANEADSPFVALAISRSIVEAQGGTLEAESREGGGTRVRIALPRLAVANQRGKSIP